MNIVFRLNYHTVPGQSLWLKYSTVLDEKGVRFDQVVPLHWIRISNGKCAWKSTARAVSCWNMTINSASPPMA